MVAAPNVRIMYRDFALMDTKFRFKFGLGVFLLQRAILLLGADPGSHLCCCVRAPLTVTVTGARGEECRPMLWHSIAALNQPAGLQVSFPEVLAAGALAVSKTCDLHKKQRT